MQSACPARQHRGTPSGVIHPGEALPEAALSSDVISRWSGSRCMRVAPATGGNRMNTHDTPEAVWRAIRAVALGLAALAAGSCGGGGGGGGGPAGPPQGTFSDSPVQGLSYVTGSQSGETGAGGGFRYDQEGDRITFSIGDIEIGNGDAARFMTPVNLVEDEDPSANVSHEWVLNIARLLQTLDDDADPANGIRITPAVRAAAAGLVVEFAQTLADFENDAAVQAAVASLTAATSAGPRGLVSVDDAAEHLGRTLIARFAGTYRGSFEDDGTPQGTWTAIVSASGEVSVASTFRGREISCGGFVSGDGQLTVSGSVPGRPSGYYLGMTAQISSGIVEGSWYRTSWPYGDDILEFGNVVGQVDEPGPG
jgi:hypothetical protein